MGTSLLRYSISLSWILIFCLVVLFVFESYGHSVDQKTFEILYNDDVVGAIKASVARWLLGLFTGVVVAIFFGIFGAFPLMPWEKRNRTVSFWNSHHLLLHFLRAIPIVALPAIVIFFLAISEYGKIFIIAWGAFFPTWLATYYAACTLQSEYLYLAHGFKISRTNIFMRVVIPSIGSQITSGVRISLGAAWLSVVASELLGIIEGKNLFGNGLGHLLWTHMNQGAGDVVLVIIFIFGLLGSTTNYLFDWILRKLTEKF